MPAGGGKDFCVVELLVWWCASTLRAFPPASLSVRSAAYFFPRKHSARIAREPARARSTCTPKRDRRRAEGECVVSKAGGTVVRSASPRASAPSATTRRSSTSCCCGIYIHQRREAARASLRCRSRQARLRVVKEMRAEASRSPGGQLGSCVEEDLESFASTHGFVEKHQRGLRCAQARDGRTRGLFRRVRVRPLRRDDQGGHPPGSAAALKELRGRRRRGGGAPRPPLLRGCWRRAARRRRHYPGRLARGSPWRSAPQPVAAAAAAARVAGAEAPEGTTRAATRATATRATATATRAGTRATTQARPRATRARTVYSDAWVRWASRKKPKK